MAKNSPAYVANPHFVEKFPQISGNRVNGLGETQPRRPSPFFWHKPELHEFGVLQDAVLSYHRQSAEIREVYTPQADRGPKPIVKAQERRVETPEAWTAAVKAFALDNDGDFVGIARTNPDWIYEGFEITEPWIIMIGVAMDYERLNQAPASLDNPTAGVEVGDKYNKAARVCRRLTNFILQQGYDAKAFQGPFATALNMIPAALASGFGELGKHGSIINRKLGSSFRLSAVATDLPLLADQPDDFGADDFCTRCQVCTQACPPDAIFEEKQPVRGIEKWYVDFDKCIPYFGDTLSCGICIVRCPWSMPGVADKLVQKLARRRESGES